MPGGRGAPHRLLLISKRPQKGPTWEQCFTRESYMGVGGRVTKGPVQQPAVKENKDREEKSSSTMPNIRAKSTNSISVDIWEAMPPEIDVISTADEDLNGREDRGVERSIVPRLP